MTRAMIFTTASFPLPVRLPQLSFYKPITHFIFNNVCCVKYLTYAIFLNSPGHSDNLINIVTQWGPGNLNRVMKKGRTHRHTYRKAGVWWVVHSGGDAPATWKLSTFIKHHWVRRWLYYTELNQEKVG